MNDGNNRWYSLCIVMFSNSLLIESMSFPCYNKKDPIINIHLYQDIVYMTLEDNKMENSD